DAGDGGRAGRVCGVYGVGRDKPVGAAIGRATGSPAVDAVSTSDDDLDGGGGFGDGLGLERQALADDSRVAGRTARCGAGRACISGDAGEAARVRVGELSGADVRWDDRYARVRAVPGIDCSCR